MRAFVTGGTGFIGGAVIRALRTEGWDITALVRPASPVGSLEAAGAAVVPGDVSRPEGLADAMRGHDVVFHLAAWYDFGVTDAQLMERINVGGPAHVIRSAGEAGVPRVVYCSSVAALGNDADGRVWDESKEHHGRYSSLYERTKHRAHGRVRELVAEGYPVVTVMPAAVYGPGDAGLMGTLLRLYASRLLLACPFERVTVSMVHVNDVAAGLVRARDAAPGSEFILGGDNATTRAVFERAQPYTRIAPPRLWISHGMLLKMAALGPVIGPLMGRRPGMLREAAATMTGTWAFSSARAERALSYRWRPVEEGIPQTVTALRRGSRPRTARVNPRRVR